MALSKEHNGMFVVYEVAALLMMINSFQMEYIRELPYSFIPILSLLVMSAFWMMNPDYFRRPAELSGLCILWGIISLYRMLFCEVFSILSLIDTVSMFLCGLTMLLLKDEKQHAIIEAVSVYMGCMLILSIGGWILYLLHVNMPHHTAYDGSFYTLSYYPTFLLNGYPYEDPIPRFAAMFQEPGHLATTCVFLLYINKFRIRKWYNMLMLIAIFLSLSLAGYGILIGAYSLYLFMFSRKRKVSIAIMAVTVTVVTIVGLYMNKGENVLYKTIISRLEYNESTGKIAGSNRYSGVFMSKYKRFIKSKDRYLGVGNLPEKQHWWNNSAGWRRAIVTNGIIGVALITLFYYLLVRRRHNKVCFWFFVLWVVSNMIRDHLLKDFWLYVFIAAMPVLSSYKLLGKEQIEEKVIEQEDSLVNT